MLCSRGENGCCTSKWVDGARELDFDSTRATTIHREPDNDRCDAGGTDWQLQHDAMVVVGAVRYAIVDKPQLEPVTMRDEVQGHKIKNYRMVRIPDICGVIFRGANIRASGCSVHQRNSTHTEKPGESSSIADKSPERFKYTDLTSRGYLRLQNMLRRVPEIRLR